MTNRTVDVLLPVYCGALTIAQAIESLQRQTVSDIRIIVIDDGSTDQTPQILAEFARQDKRIEIVTKPNSGIVNALNLGLEKCEAEFVARQDADDISYRSRFSLQTAYLRSNRECIAVSGSVRHIDEWGRPTGFVQIFSQPERAAPHWAPAREPYLCHPFLMVRRAALQAVGGYRYAYNSEDTDLYWRLIEHGTLHNLQDVLGEYRLHSSSISAGSIVNGRIMALSSQLSAISARRRMERRSDDILFLKEAIREYHKAPSLAALVMLAGTQLDENERRYLAVATAGKLLELAAYRPYELDLDDCRFIRQALDKVDWLPSANRDDLERLQSAAAARFLRGRKFREAAVLTPPRLHLSTAARLAAASLPKSLSGLIRRALHRRW